jgi:hypothetical protein
MVPRTSLGLALVAVAATALAEAKTEYNRSLAKLFGPTRA